MSDNGFCDYVRKTDNHVGRTSVKKNQKEVGGRN